MTVRVLVVEDEPRMASVIRRSLAKEGITAGPRGCSGTSTAEFGPPLFLDYPGPEFTPIHRTNDLRQVLPDNT